MRQNVTSRALAVLLVTLFIFSVAEGQAPPTIQFFMPDGSLPTRQLRFNLTSEDGRTIEIFFTDTRGRFLMARSQGLRPNVGYTLLIEGDERTFDTTTVKFYHYGDSVYYVPIFLKPLKPKAMQPAKTIDIAELDSLVPKEAIDIYHQAMRAFSEGRADEAVAGLKSAVKIYPSYFRALNDMGVILMKLNRLDEAAQSFEQASRAAPRVYYPRLNLAIIKTRQKKFKEAAAMLEQLHKENPTPPEIRVALGDALMAVGRLDDAEPQFRAALAEGKLDRDATGNAHYLLGLLLNRKERFEEAIKELELAAKILPNASRVHLQLGGSLLQVKRLDEAERELSLAYQLDGPKMGAAQFLLGHAFYLNKKYDKAKAAFEQYLADVPEAPNATEVRGVIEKIKSAFGQKQQN